MKRQRFCAKCKKEVEYPSRNALTVYSMGQGSYGVNTNPLVCHRCHSEWHDLWGKINRRLILETRQKSWKETFEEWIGYEWSIEAENPNLWSVS